MHHNGQVLTLEQIIQHFQVLWRRGKKLSGYTGRAQITDTEEPLSGPKNSIEAGEKMSQTASMPLTGNQVGLFISSLQIWLHIEGVGNATDGQRKGQQ